MPTQVFVSAHGNVFMTEIAEHLVEALRLGGRDADLVTDRLPVDVGDPLDNLVVAPHEFFPLFSAPEAARAVAASHAACINTEQTGTPFFDLAMRYVTEGVVAFDINTFTIDTIRAAGIPAIHLPLGYVPSMDQRRPTGHERAVDLAFMGGRTPRRETFVAGAAGVLWEWRTDLRFFSWHRPALAHDRTFSAGDDKYRRLADSRILLNVHRSEDPYFEWARVVEAMANGCVVASERSVGIEPLRPGVHLLVAELEDLAEEAVALAFDEPRRSAMATAAHELLVGELHQTRLVERALVEARSETTRARGGGRSAAATQLQRGARQISRGAAVFGSRVAAASRATPNVAVAEREVLEKTARDLKLAYLEGMRNIRSIERAIALAEHGDPDHVTSTTSAAYDDVAPVVSVVIPLFDQGQFLTEAVASVVAAASGDSPVVEVVIVDDHSTDDSLAVALALVDEHPWFPIRVVARAANGGLPVARNTGFSLARGRYVFALDADNLLFPSGLRLLADHLDGADPDVVAAYGLLERFAVGGSIGLVSHLPWDVHLLVRGGFIDAMALFRRSAWEALGGYADSIDVYGWEDYDLWLRAAARGQRADLVPQFVGRYREQPGSMRAISDIDMATSFVVLRERHPRLPWPS